MGSRDARNPRTRTSPRRNQGKPPPIGRWLEKFSYVFEAHSRRWLTPRIIVLFTLALWVLLLGFGILKIHNPMIVIWPLYAFYPHPLVSKTQNFNATFMHAWGVGIGAVCLALAVFATWRKSRLVAIIFMVFFIVSTLISCARIVGGLHNIHQ